VVISLVCLSLSVITLLNYQSSNVVIRITHLDGRVEISGGRVPWRRPDFEAGGTKEIEVIRKDGTRFLVRKIEMWFREKDSRKRLIEMFRGIEPFSEQP